MKSLRFTLLNSLIFLGLCLGIASFACAAQAPALQQPQGLVSSIKGGLWSLGKTGLTGAGVALGVSVLYLAYCRSKSKDWDKEISAAEQETIKLDATSNDVAAQRNLFRYWNLRPGSACAIAKNWKTYYYMLTTAFPVDGSKANFVKVTKEKIEQEKIQIKRLFGGLDNCFSQNTILPRMSRYNAIFDNPVRALIAEYMKENNCELFYKLSPEQFAKLDQEMRTLTSFSIRSLFNKKPWKTFNWHRIYALPYESDAIEQYWKLYQMIAHLDALEFCLTQALSDDSLV